MSKCILIESPINELQKLFHFFLSYSEHSVIYAYVSFLRPNQDIAWPTGEVIWKAIWIEGYTWSM